MPDFFDSEEEVALGKALLEKYLARSGLTAEEFRQDTRSLLRAIRSCGFDRVRVEQHLLGNGHKPVAGDFVDLIWESVRRKAEELARSSLTGGLTNLPVFLLYFLLVLLRETKVESLRFMTDRLPTWVVSGWLQLVMGIGVATCLIHALRGYFTLSKIQASASSPTEIDETSLRLLDLRGIRPQIPLPNVKQVLLSLTFLGSIAAGCFVLNGMLRTIGGLLAGGQARIEEISDALLVGIVLWFMASAIGWLLLGIVGCVPARPYFKVDRRGAELVFKALFCWQVAAAGFLLLVSAWFIPSSGYAIVLIISGGAISAGFARMASRAYSVAKQHMALSVDELLRSDRRAPILYLRSFAEDSTAAPYDYSAEFKGYSAFRMFQPSYWIEHRGLSLEEIICKGLGRAGPVIAIGEPGEPLPKLGAARKYVTHSEWQEEVKRLIARSRFVCLVVGHTEGLLWEFEQLAQQGDGRRLLMLIPPEFGLVWETFVKNCEKKQTRVYLPRRMPQNGLGICFSRDWQPTVIVGRPTVGSYRKIALQILSTD